VVFVEKAGCVVTSDLEVVDMGKRHGMSRRSSKRNFTHNAMRVNRRNATGASVAMRGGIRL
jgi:hypothetical protein